MTRWLSEALQAKEPDFRLGLRRFEEASGNISGDIRLSSRVQQQTNTKLLELGLDPKDTTAEELYHALTERVKTDDARLTRKLQTLSATHVTAEADVVSGMVHALDKLPDSSSCFALKSSTLRSIIKKYPPKKAMKHLGYRSPDSFIKHERLALIMAAGWLSESANWQHQIVESYKRLKSTDFEVRRIAVIQPDSKKWQELSMKIVSHRKHNLISFRELGTIILLPLPKDIPDGVVTTSMSLALHELNEIKAASSFLKICQVRPDFGEMVRAVVSEELALTSDLTDQPVPWHLIQRYYSKLGRDFKEEIFGPHIRQEDMSWRSVEESLMNIEPSLKFWLDSDHLGLLHEHQPVSLNIVDVALNLCNNLPFEKRLTKAFQKSLWHELLLQYLKHDTVENTVLNQLQPQSAYELAID